jgi:hypothetical protein
MLGIVLSATPRAILPGRRCAVRQSDAAAERGPDGPLIIWRNAVAVVPIAILQPTIYFTLNHFPLRPSRLLPLTALDAWVPFWPWTVWPYLALIAAPAVLAMFVRSRAVFDRALIAYVSAMGAAFVVFALWPTHFPRAELADKAGWHAPVYRLLRQVDTEQCCFPSAHLIAPTVVCWGVWRDGRRWGWLPLLLLPLFALSILTTKQHYVWDLLGGFAFAAAGIAASGLGADKR